MDDKILTLAHTALCVLLLIFSFVVIAPLAVLLRNFGGHCIIGADISFSSHGGHDIVVAQDMTAAQSHCVYPEFMGFVVLFFSIAYLVWNTCFLVNSWQSRERDSFIGICVTGLISFMLLISSSVLSAGINSLCGHLGKGKFDCLISNYKGGSWLKYIDHRAAPVDNINPEGYHTLLQTAEAGSWLSFITFLFLLGGFVLKLKNTQSGLGYISNLRRERQSISERADQRRYGQI